MFDRTASKTPVKGWHGNCVALGWLPHLEVEGPSCDMAEETSKVPAIHFPTCASHVCYICYPKQQIELCCLQSAGKPPPFSRDPSLWTNSLEMLAITVNCSLCFKTSKKEREKKNHRGKMQSFMFLCTVYSMLNGWLHNSLRLRYPLGF